MKKEIEYDNYKLKGRETTGNNQDGRQYTVFVYAPKPEGNFKFTAKVSGTAINTNTEDNGFGCDSEKAITKMRKKAFKGAKEKIDKNDFNDENYVHKIISK